jgi:hypothetical protein
MVERRLTDELLTAALAERAELSEIAFQRAQARARPDRPLGSPLSNLRLWASW